MIYKNFQDLKLSALGMGAMRLPTIDGDDHHIDEQATKEMVAYAMEKVLIIMILHGDIMAVNQKL